MQRREARALRAEGTASAKVLRDELSHVGGVGRRSVWLEKVRRESRERSSQGVRPRGSLGPY
jgi:hypothetical protein